MYKNCLKLRAKLEFFRKKDKQKTKYTKSKQKIYKKYKQKIIIKNINKK